MFFLRYLFSIVFSFFIHSLAFSSAPPKNQYLTLDSTQASSLAIQLMTPVKVEEEAKNTIKEQQTPNQSTTAKAIKQRPSESKKSVKAVKKEQHQVKKKEQKKRTSKTENVINDEQKKKPMKPPPPPQKRETEKPNTASATSKQQSTPKRVEKATFSARPAPIAYPRSAKKRNIEGLVLIEVWVDEQGKQTQQRVINSSGHPILDKAALKGITKWHFSRQQEDGLAIAYRVQVPINFGLN